MGGEYGLNHIARKAIADWILGGTAPTIPSTFELIPLTAITDEDAGTYTAATAVSALAVTNNTTNWSNATGTTTVTKTNAVQFQTGNFSSEQTIVGIALKDQANSNVWAVETLTSNITVASGTPFTISAGQITISTNAGTAYINTKILDRIFGNTAFSVPSTLYWAPVTAITSAAAGTVTEIGSLARVSYTNNSTNFGAATGTTTVNKANSVELSSGNFPSNQTVVGSAFFDASSSGNCLFAVALTSNRAVTLGNPFRMAIGDWDWNLSNT